MSSQRFDPIPTPAEGCGERAARTHKRCPRCCESGLVLPIAAFLMYPQTTIPRCWCRACETTYDAARRRGHCRGIEIKPPGPDAVQLRRMQSQREIDMLAELDRAHAAWNAWTRPRHAIGQAKLGVRVDPLRGRL